MCAPHHDATASHPPLRGQATRGEGWLNNTGWLGGGEECEWHGVYCEGSQVVSVDLRSNELMGVLPSNLSMNSLMLMVV